MKFLIGYLAIGALAGLWCAFDLDPEDIGSTSRGDLWMARVAAVPFHVLLWPWELFLTIRAAVRGEE